MPTRTQELRAKQHDRGRRATAPIAIPWRGWKDIAYRLFIGFTENRVLLTAAGVAYFLLFALVPSLSLFVSLYGLLNDPVGVVDQLSLLDGLVPSSGLDIIREQLVRLTSQDSGELGLALVISLVAALWGASAGIKALFDAMNVVYGEQEKRNIFHIHLLALAFIFGGLVMLVLMLAVMIGVPALLQVLALGGYEWLVRAGAYVLMLVSLLVALSSIYRWGPSRAVAKWRWVTPGSLFATVGIMLMSAGYSWYAANFARFSATYGSLGAVIGFLTWIWLSVTIVILGGSLNSESEHQTTADSTTGEPRPMGTRGAYVADTVGGRWPAKGGDAAKEQPASEDVVKR